MSYTINPDFIKAVFYHVPRPPRHTGGFYLHLDETEKPNQDFFHYTSGRWLWDEENRQQERYKQFDVAELMKIAAASVGANKCLTINKIGEGGSNRAFRLTFDNGRTAIARLPMHQLSGPPFLSMASEVATMDFARNIIGVPAPEVFAWSPDASNTVGSEYMIMGEAEGTQLGELWPTMTMNEKIALVEEVVALEKRMLSVSLNCFGSLYYAENAPPDSRTAIVKGTGIDDDPEIQAILSKRFAIGPMVEQSWWRGERANMNIDRGPWMWSTDYIDAVIIRELRWLEEFSHKTPQATGGPFESSPIQGDRLIHQSLLCKFSEASAPLLVRGMSVAHLHHEDIYYGNIFVKDGKITSLIDWQASWVGPLQLQARAPPFLDVPKIQRLELPKDTHLLPPVQRKKVIEQVQKTTLLRTYLQSMEKECPDFYTLLKLPQSKLLVKGLQFVDATWDGGVLPLRGTLFKIQTNWHELRPDIACPIELEEKEMLKEAEDAESFNQMRRFWASVHGWIYKDGWVSNARYAEAVELFSGLRDGILEHITGKEKEAFQNDSQWVDVAKNRIDCLTAAEKQALDDDSQWVEIANDHIEH